MVNRRLLTRIREGVLLATCPMAIVVFMLTTGCVAQGPTGGRPALEVTSTAFAEAEPIPSAFTCDGEDHSPPLSWSPVPPGTRSIALMVTDPDAPRGTFVHWVAYNIPPGTRNIPAGGGGQEVLPAGSREGTNDMGEAGYNGPCPPGGKPHHYRFTVSALDTTLTLEGNPDGRSLEKAMAGHVLAQGVTVGIYQRA